MPGPDKRKTLVFHIGDHKTGSTSIQLAFAQHRVVLQGHSLFYPAKLAMNALGGQFTAYGQAKTEQERRATAQPLEKLVQRIQQSDADFVLISAEDFEGVPVALFHEIVETFFAKVVDEIRIIGYVRPHAARIISSFAERTKIGIPTTLTNDLAGFAARRKSAKEFIYLPRFAAWRDHFADKFILRPMIRSQLHQGSVVDDFLHHAFGGIPFTVADSPSKTAQANESLCLEDLMRLKVMQGHLAVKPNIRLKVGWEFARLVSHMPPPPTRTKIQLHRSLARDIRASYMKDARSLDQAFFGGAPLMENELHDAVKTARTRPQSTAPSDYLCASELRSLELLSGMVKGLLEKEGVNWPAFLHRKRIRDVEQARISAPSQ
ncbi:hypothetical protein PH5382_03311 [Phaeobacter sp. CECT 5382]|uniref:hypothetical protein n=1 Tax=Phaeobacter sp. CECT 5382 TaxID=1712645 RepID=UPI0006DB4C1B|nr:hypothetical protein [Phaeobacter sp. CECT 5382]CUH89365.1 hypothetical protein PH5382_03311 [Phaeobacter sp. CECT 5382]